MRPWESPFLWFVGSYFRNRDFICDFHTFISAVGSFFFFSSKILLKPLAPCAECARMNTHTPYTTLWITFYVNFIYYNNKYYEAIQRKYVWMHWWYPMYWNLVSSRVVWWDLFFKWIFLPKSFFKLNSGQICRTLTFLHDR